VPIALKSGSLNLLEPSGPVQACNGIALLLCSSGILRSVQLQFRSDVSGQPIGTIFKVLEKGVFKQELTERKQ